MNDDPYDFFDALLGVHQEWSAILAEYRRHAAELVRDSLVDRRLSPSATRGVLGELLTHTTAAEQLSIVLDALEIELARADEQRVTRTYNARTLSTGDAAQSDG